MTNTSIDKADYGFEIRGTLDSKVKSDYGLDKDKVIVLLVLPIENRANIDSSEANFHLKSNFVFDFGMRVGSVQGCESLESVGKNLGLVMENVAQACYQLYCRSVSRETVFYNSPISIISCCDYLKFIFSTSFEILRRHR